MNPEPLTNANFLLYASKCYDNPSCHSTLEFLEDLKRFKYIKKLVTRYTASGDLKERLILNHVIILNNLFGADALPRMFLLKMPDQLTYVAPFLILLNIWPDNILNVGGPGVFKTDTVHLDHKIVEVLRGIGK